MYEGDYYPVTAIAAGAFADCDGLKSLTLPATLTSIGDNAFAGCTSLTSLILPAGLTTLGNAAFAGCSAMAGVLTIPAKLASIAPNAFAGCAALSAVTLQAFTPPTLGEAAFAGIPADCKFACPASALPDYQTDAAWKQYFPAAPNPSVPTPSAPTPTPSDPNLPAASAPSAVEHPLGVPSASALGLDFKIVTIDGVSTATITGFSGGTAAAARTTLAIPSTVSSAGVSYPVTAIGEGAFRGCRSLISVTFPAGLTAIGTQAFANCTGLSALTLPAGMTEIGIHAFFGCTGLTSVRLLSTTPPALLTFLKSASGNAFEGVPAHCTFTCPAAALYRYQANADWAPFFPSAVADDDDGKTSVVPAAGGESAVSLYTLRGQLLRQALLTLPATPAMLRSLLGVPPGVYILASPGGTQKIQL
jgi:hypothetical protein